MVCFSPKIEQQKQFCSCEANDLCVVWCSYNEPTSELTNRLHALLFLSHSFDKVVLRHHNQKPFSYSTAYQNFDRHLL